MPGTNDVKAGGAFVEIFAKSERFHKSLKEAERDWMHFGATLMRIGGAMVATGFSIGGALFAAAKHAANVGSEFVDMAERTGLSVESLSAFKFALGQTGATIEEFEVAVKKMQKAIASDESAKKFDEIGLSLTDLRRMEPHEQIVMLAEAIDQIQSPAFKTAAALEIFGKAGTKLLPLFSGGAEGLQKLLARAQELGLVMSTEDAKAAEMFGDSLETIQNIASRAVSVIGSSMIPAFQGLADWITENAAVASRWVDENRGLIINVAVAGIAITALGAGFLALGAYVWASSQILLGTVAVLKAVTLGMWLMVTSTKAMIMAMTASPILALAISLRYVIGYIFALGDAVKNAKASIADAFWGMVDDVKQAWSSIAAALAKGDLGAAAAVGLTFVKLEFARAAGAIKASWVEIKSFAVSVWWSIGAEIVKAMSWAMAEVHKSWNTTKDLGFKIMTGYAYAAAKVKQKLGLITDEEWEKIRVALRDADIENQRKLAGDNKEVDARLDAERKAIDRLRDAEQAAINQGKEDELAVLRGQLKEAQDKFKAAQEEARRPDPVRANGANPKLNIPDMDAMQKKLASAGTFNGALVNQIIGGGANGPEEKQVKLQERLVNLMQAMNRKLDGLGGMPKVGA
jgi:hypothetical protein